MKQLITVLIISILFGCNHPESKTYERNQGTKNNLETIESNKNDAKNNSTYTENDINEIQKTEFPKVEIDNLNVLKMENQNGVKYVWIEINGIRLRFIFDTGASSICISPAEANVLYRQGTLRKEDILDKEYFQDATGKISEGTKVNLRNVKIGNKILENIY